MTVADLQRLALCAADAHHRYSQVEEDAVLDALAHTFGLAPGTFVEIGVGPGFENNTRRCAEDGWRGLWIGDEPILLQPPAATRVIQATVTPDNVRDLLGGVPAHVDLLSIDIDGNDYWIGQIAIPFLTPTILIVEYCRAATPGWIMPYAAGYRWHTGQLCGASLAAWVDLLAHDYELVYTTRAQVNAIFVRRSAMAPAIAPDAAVLSSPPCADSQEPAP